MMNCLNRWFTVGLLAAVPVVSGCDKQAAATVKQEHPSTVEKTETEGISRVTFTDHAMQRVDVKTAAVTEEKSPRTQATQMAIPYSALLYDMHGNTWVYTSPKPNVFVRAPIEVDYILNDIVYLKSGPDPGTSVASVGVAELYGTEFKVGH
jgi:hypothetical protein